MELPTEIYNNIISDYIPIKFNGVINKKLENKRSKKIKNAKMIINNNIHKYMIDFRKNSNIDYFENNKYIYKKFYPLYLRTALVKLSLTKVKSVNHNDHLKIYNNMINNKNIVYNFNKFIDSIEQDKLNYIGW